MELFRVGDAVVLRKPTNDYRIDDLVLIPGIVLDIQEMNDGFLMIEVLMNDEVNWFDEIELKLAGS